MKVCDISFDEYGELVGVSLKDVGENYEKEKEEFLEENEESIKMIDGGMYLESDWGNYNVVMEVNEEKYVYVRMDEEGEVVESGLSKSKLDCIWNKHCNGVYLCEDEDEMKEYERLEKEGDFEGLRRRGFYMIDISEVEDYHMRKC